MSEVNGGFVAGTLVHTINGLRPIEELRGNDLVLSRPKMGVENTYKRVARMSKHTDKPVLVNKYALSSPYKDPLQTQHLIISTLDHPFWLNDLGWTASERLRFDGPEEPMLSLADGGVCWYRTSSRAYATDVSQIFVPDYPDVAQGGNLLDPNTNSFMGSTSYNWERWSDENEVPRLALRDVYNIEVEDFHSYFVGEHGVWVHDAACT